MTKDEALKLALEALEEVVKWYGVRDKNDVMMSPHNQNPEIKESIEAITALRQALRNQALDKKAENARELGLDYEPKCEWVGLTDEEYEALAEKYVTNCYFDTLKYAKAMEVILRSKNT